MSVSLESRKKRKNVMLGKKKKWRNNGQKALPVREIYKPADSRSSVNPK